MSEIPSYSAELLMLVKVFPYYFPADMGVQEEG